MAWFNPNDPTSGADLLTQEQIENRRKVAERMAAAASKARPMTHWAQALAQGAEGVAAGFEERSVRDAIRASSEYDRGQQANWGAGSVAAPAATVVAPVAVDTAPAGGAIAGGGSLNVSPEIKNGIVQTASALGIDPVDLATTISYETGGTFDPTKRGPTTQWGQHRGLIQFGEPQAKQHGVDWSNPVGSQLGPNGAVASYLKTAGVKPGMGLLDIYSAINAGAPGLYDRSDAKNGGAPGTVRDKVEKQMQGHRAKAQALFAAAQSDMPAPGAMPAEMPTGQEGFAVPSAVESIPGDDPARLRMEAQAYAQTNPEAARQMLARADAAEAAASQVAPMPMPPARPADLALSAPAAPAMNGATFDQVASMAPPLEPVFQSEGASQPWMGTALQPQPASPAARVAQAMQSAPMPPPRPTNLAADLPAPGAIPAIGQMPQAVPAMPDLSNTSDGGMRALQVMALQQAQGQPQAPMPGPTPGMPVAQASLPAAAPTERVAQAVTAAQAGAPAAAPQASPAAQRIAALLPGVDPAVARSAFDPKVSPQTRQMAQLIVQQQLAAAKKADPIAVEKAQVDLAIAKKNLGKSDAPTAIQEFEYGQKTPGYSEWKQQQSKAGASSVNVGGGSDKQIFDTFAENVKEARAAANGLVALREARGAVQGGAIFGAGADLKLGLQKAAAAFGVGDTEKIQNTETFRSAIAPQIAAVMKSTVGSANISNSDREFAEKAAGGSITLDQGSITRLLDIMERASVERLKLHNEQLDAVYPDPVGNKRERALFGVKIPEPPKADAPPSAVAGRPAGQTKSGVKWSVQ